MDFNIAAGSATNLPKETVDKIVELAVENSIVLKMIDQRGQLIEIVNEGTVPVIAEASVDKVFRLDSTADITSVTEQSFDVRSPDLFPVESGQWIRLKDKSLAQYPEMKLDSLFEKQIANAFGRAIDRLALIGDTTIVGATNILTISNGIATIAGDATLCAQTPVSYTASTSQGICDAVNEAIETIGLYGDYEFADDLVLLASPTFITSARNSADKNIIGFEIGEYAPLGLKNVVHIHGIPLIKRTLITGEKAVLVNMKGAFAGYYGNMSVEVQREANRRGNLMVMTYWIDFKWAFIDASDKAVGMVEIEKTS